MLIIHRLLHLGVVNQKPPELWVSHRIPERQEDNVGYISFGLGDVRLNEVTKTIRNISNTTLGISIGDQRLIDPTKLFRTDDSTSISLGVGNHGLYDGFKNGNTYIDNTVVSLGVGNHRLYNWGVSAQVLYDDKVSVMLGTGNHRLYEDK